MQGSILAFTRLFFSIILCVFLFSCSQHSSSHFLGYIEGRYVYLSSPVSGYLTQLGVRKGETVKANTLAFQLDPQPELSQLQAAKAELSAESHQLENLKQGQRETIIRSLEAQVAQAKANLDYSKKMVDRNQRLIKTGAIDQATVDRSRAAYQTDLQKWQELQANVAEAKQGARTQAIFAQESRVNAAAENVHHLQWLVDQKTIRIPENAFVQDVLFRQHELVPAGKPVISLLPPENRILVFFVPESSLSQIKMGQSIYFTCDGCHQNQLATIDYISSQAEFTPPVIYSKDSREKLVYWVEARIDPSNAPQFHPGEPVQVWIKS